MRRPADLNAHAFSMPVGWVISGDQSIASSRLQGFNIHKYYLEYGLSSDLITSDFNQRYSDYTIDLVRLARHILKAGYEVVYFERPNWMMYKLSQWCRLNGIRTVAIRCDEIPGEYDRYFEATIVPTVRLRDLLGIRKAYVIEDMIEVPAGVFKDDYSKTGEHLKVVWVGHGSYRTYITQFLDALSRRDGLRDEVEFITISKGDWATYSWSLETVFSHILRCDIAIVPIPEGPQYSAKSANRLTMFMALGMPTIVSPLPAYLAIAEQGENCLVARSADEFGQAIQLLQNQSRREKLGRQARDYAWKHFSSEIIGAQWLSVLQDIVDKPLPDALPAGLRDRLIARLLRL